MNELYSRIHHLARPFLDTRGNDAHTELCIGLALEILKQEGGDEDVVIPAVILHDVGWKRIPEELQLQAFGPKATRPDLNRRHEEEGARIARAILNEVGYPPAKTQEIVKIVEGHDSRAAPISLNDMIVKDSDKLWRYTAEGFAVDIQRFEENPGQGLHRLRANLDRWFCTAAARKMAEEEWDKTAGHYQERPYTPREQTDFRKKHQSLSD